MKCPVQSIVRTDVGRVRKTNEDSYLIDCDDGLFVVADGMGGHEAGEVASALAVKAIASYWQEEREKAKGIHELEIACQKANYQIYQESQKNPKLSGMGTTVTALFVSQGSLMIAHVGDSRAYKMSLGKLHQLTLDHSFVEEMVRQGKITKEEAQAHPQRNVITRALGTHAEVKVDLIEEKWAYEDLVLLCTDGLTNLVTEQEIEEVFKIMVQPFQRDVLEKSADRLMELVLERGGHDNVTFLILWHEDQEGWSQ
ncbi:Stp1/IreP family PP2C-type Ser/Thr phosphatase [Heliorestis convoluta]|uniref:Protein serine/threonine phosphatase, putative n=1 Tax=Heliorestis convoluta TaxID=356322 RepID=A0A5Q2N2A2_9FIRM|nr:Stp1/IreP family PP2C-type Ser/Thr phosphatase [Heliorestis convoluta]QGG47983.1 Protein serine/threonine phosphatase, putative [Heliorestis convoluta]